MPAVAKRNAGISYARFNQEMPVFAQIEAAKPE